MTYFKNINTLEKLRKQYKELIKIHHPDNGGNVSDIQEVNAEYDKLFKILKDRHNSNTTGKENASYDNMKYDFTEDQKLREMLNKIISFSGITIEICGSWIWTFNSYNYRKELKEMNFKFAGKKKAWYWHSEAFKKKGKKLLSMNDIRSYYGSTEIQPEQRPLLKQA